MPFPIDIKPAQLSQELIDLNRRLSSGMEKLRRLRVELAKVTMPVLNIYADKDHLVPPKTTTALAKYVGTQDYQEAALPGGHIGVYVGGRTQKTLAPMISNWLHQRQ